MAAQLTATNGFSARALMRCKRRAKASLPTPDSPVNNTVAWVRATRSSWWQAELKADEAPTISCRSPPLCAAFPGGTAFPPCAAGTAGPLAVERRRHAGQPGATTHRSRGFSQAAKVARLQVAQVFAHIAPGGCVAADHAARAGAHRSALDLTKHHQLPEQAGHVAGRITHLRPARRFGAQAVGSDVFVVFAGVLPQELALVGAAVDVEVECQRLDHDHAFERVQPRAGHEHRRRITLRPALAHQLRVARARHVARAREQAARAVDAQRVDQLAPQVAHRRRVPQQHALVVEPDAAVAGREEQRLGQVGQGRRQALDEMRAVAAAQHRAGLARHLGKRDAGVLGRVGCGWH